MQQKSKRSDLHEVIRQERRRGKRPVDESRRKAKQSLVQELFEEDEATFLESIRVLGLQEGSVAWKEALSAFRDEQRGRGRVQRGRL